MSEKGLRLHKDKGVNAHMTLCSRCGGEGQELIMLGAHDKKVTCNSCGMVHIGMTKRSLKTGCKNCHSGNLTEEIIADNEKLPIGLCEDCEKEIAEHKKVIDSGGLHFKCDECGCLGVIKPSKFTESVRQSALDNGMIKTLDAEFGIEFNKCAEHETDGGIK